MKRGLACAILVLYASINATQADVPRSVVTEATLDFESSREFPKHPKPFYVDFRPGILGALHISGPMQPHSQWSTGATGEPTVHIRVAFNDFLPVGSIIGANGWQVSTLRPDAPYPGDVYDEAQWQQVPGVEGQAGLRVLPLPEVAETRAVRFSRTRTLQVGEERSESLAGAIISERRFHNLSPEATAYASSEAVSNQREREANSAQNLTTGGSWLARRSDPITPEKPEWVILHWDTPREFRYVGLLNAFAKRVEFDIYTGDAAVHPLTAAEDTWQQIGGINPPVWWRPAYTDCYFDLGDTHTTTAIRMRITQPLSTEDTDIRHRTGGAENITSLGGFMVMTELGNAPIPPRPTVDIGLPPLAIRYDMPAEGKVAIAIDDAQGVRVRNLIADAPRSAGANVEHWDGLDDNGTLVGPGEYTVKTISHEPLSIRWHMTPHNAKDVPWWNNPSWGGHHGPGSFMSDHATPRSVCVLGDRVFIGSSIAESGHSMSVLDLDGNKVWGTKWFDTAGASELATDGEKIFIGAQGGWIRDTVMIFELDPATYRHRRLVQFAIDPPAGVTGGISGLAARDGLIYASFNASPRSALASALSASNIDTEHSPQGNLGSLLRAGGTPTPHHWLPARGEGDVRHIRIAFKSPQPIGSILLPSSGAQFSALKSDAPYPGDVDNEAHWTAIPSESIGSVQMVLPHAGISTRALRMTWQQRVNNQGIQGFKIFGHRFSNIIGDAEITASSGTPSTSGGWRSETKPEDRPISVLEPEELVIRWNAPRTVRGFALINPFVKELEIEIQTAAGWESAGKMIPPVWWRPSYHDAYHDFGRNVSISAIRLRATSALTSENPDVHGTTGGGKPLFVSIGGIAVLQPLGNDPELPPDLAQRITVYNAADGGIVRHLRVPSPRGLKFAPNGRLYAVSGNGVVAVNTETGAIQSIVTENLGRPIDLAIDQRGAIYVSDAEANQVKVFAPNGRFLRAIGRPGGRTVGIYNRDAMSNPQGIDIDSRGQLWVAEAEYQPKRVSWWNSGDGSFVNEKMGPARYGAGGWLDPQDPNRFYYDGMEFTLDWEGGDWDLRAILYRGVEGIPAGRPERPIYYAGRRFIVTDPGHHYGHFAMITEHRGDYAQPLAVAGSASAWPLLRTPAFQAMHGTNFNNKGFIWVDANGDGKPQPNEVQIGPDLNPMYFTSFIADDLTLNFGRIHLPIAGFNAVGAPIYDFANAVQRPSMPVTGTYSHAMLPSGSLFSVSSPIALQRPDGSVPWTYPENYCGVHASHHAPRPSQGEVVGSLMYVGHAQADADIGTLTGLMTNFGYITLFTEDGLHAARLFDDYRNGVPGWHSTTAERGMEVGGFSLGGEHFHGSFTRTADGRYFVVAGHNHSSISEVHGLETLSRSQHTLTIGAQELAACDAYMQRRALVERRREAPRFVSAPHIENFSADADLAEWEGVDSADIRGVGTARMAWNDTHLLLAFDVKDDTPLLNSGDQPSMLFKTGDSIDLQISTNPAADSNRTDAAPGDVRLLITETEGRPIAVLYRHSVPGTPHERAHFFSSPARTVRVDVIDVYRDLPIAISRRADGYIVEAGIPHSVLGIEPVAGKRLRVDFGILRSDARGEETRERLYWSNPATAIINDIPSEIQLTPALWGIVEFGR